ncbi:hypothetical protein PPL_02441 [Heterostelium album PN500]|uniref:Integrase catalytic domain-containing protein n=1 Tax=Heterostelium pallidum (strain ATCC 26659 / Pp 5 / PN500) TaxID=670386 RepID=D3AZQ7_HETP5|nr:hypothetical protein PPL_02441 [Heterostelium album PN500]EFA85436.1 hypothetical protein PPL_02441 [Heterostelium album PN500]|eukprot:XP_020437545.1 hypothetical protein PPL_02441 [Heterostelium album PN500]
MDSINYRSTDYKNIKFLREQYAIGINSRINRWLQFIELFDPTLHYIKGETNVVPNGLSRYTVGVSVNTLKVSYDNDLLDDIRYGYDLESKMIENNEIKLQKLYNSIAIDVLRGLLKPLPVMSHKFVAISCDFIPSLKEVEDDNGNVFNQIWVIVDRFSKYVTLILTHNTYKSEDLYNLFMSNYVKYFDVPREITSDRDSKLTSKLNFTTADHQQANGQAEIVIELLKIL